MNNCDDYVFKTSSAMVEVSHQMDQDGAEKNLQDEEAFFDGCHRRCCGYKSLGP